MTRQGEVVAGPGGSRYATWVYGAADFCGGADGCDAAWFDRMGVVRSGDRIAVVTFRELGGPLEPDGLDATMTELLETLRRRHSLTRHKCADPSRNAPTRHLYK